MAKLKMPAEAAKALSARERMILFCVCQRDGIGSTSVAAARP
jgi:hypothetical protein